MEDNSNQVNDIKKLAVAVTQMRVGPNGENILLVPEGFKPEVYERKDDLPDYISHQQMLIDADSFIAYVNKYKSEKTALFQRASERAIRAKIDFHGKDQPDRCAHQAYFDPQYSDQWKAWGEFCGVPKSQRQFLEFIEENGVDFETPTHAAMLDVVATFEATKKAEFKSGIKLANGTHQLRYEETIESGGKGVIEFPASIVINIPVFKGDAAYKLKIFVRYSIRDGELKFNLKRHRAQAFIDDAFEQMAAKIAKETGITPYVV